MFNQEIPSHNILGVNFSVYTAEDILKLSVKEVTNPQSFDALSHPTIGGLYDPAYGPCDRDEVCVTCGLGQAMCPGHMGHIRLPLPVYNPVLFKILLQLLKGTCFSCHRLVARKTDMLVLQYQLEALNYGLIDTVGELEELYKEMIQEHGGDFSVDDTDLQDRLKDIIADAKSRLDDVEAAKRKSHVKNIVAIRQGLIKSFISGEFFKGSACRHCSTPRRSLRAEHNCKVYFVKGLSRRQAIKIFQKQREMKKAQQKREQDSDETPLETDAVVEQESLIDEKELAELMNNQEYLMPSRIKQHLQKVWKNDAETLQIVFGALNMKILPGKFATDMFFLEILPVPPSKFRPVASMGDRKFENPQTGNLSQVVEDIIILKRLLNAMKRLNSSQEVTEEDLEQEDALKILPGGTMVEKLHNVWLRMQNHTNVVMDSSLDKLSKDKQPGVKQLLEKKEGLFRKHMMGKRVNFAARSVISPDPYIATNEIGIPDVFATRLTYPQPVTPWNFSELKQAVINGPDKHPGALHVVHEDGMKTILSKTNSTQREALAKQLLTPSTNKGHIFKNKVVHRHLKDGDVLLLNRQPTLHRPSIQAHKARILPAERTLRLHYANCKAYNADFDGDEMNAHFPQDEISRAEAYNIASTDYQYLVPKDGTPLAGLIQDHMVSGVTLTMRGRFFCRGDYQQLVYSALTDIPGHVKLLPPAMLKPQVLWSGKQVLSTILLNIIPKNKPPLNLVGKSKVSEKQWNCLPLRSWTAGGRLEGNNMSESEVVIRGGELMVGVLDKGHYGNTPYGLVHSCYELYGGPVAGQLLSCLARIFTSFLQYFQGFTLGVEDILCTKKADKTRRRLMKEGSKTGREVAAKAFNMPQASDPLDICDKIQEAHFISDGSGLKDLDLCMKGQTDEIQNGIAKSCMPGGLEKLFPHNNLQLMVQTGAKGSSVNCMQISCLLGQIELEGRRPPLMMSGQSLPSFLAYDTSPRAGGFVDGRFLTGIRPQEYFFHCMAGREGLVDTAVKTSRSGYLQRCIIKHMEGLTISYDLSVRDSDGSVIQFQYGEDSLDICKTQYLKENQVPFMISNKQVIASADKIAIIKSKLDTEKAPALLEKIRKWTKKTRHKKKGERGSPFLHFSKKQWPSVIEKYSNSELEQIGGRTKASGAVITLWQALPEEEKEHIMKKHGAYLKSPDPLIATARPDRHFGSITEAMDQLIQKYLHDNPHKLIDKCAEDESGVGAGQISEGGFQDLMYMQTMKSLVEPGDAVGLLAAQSIGEPSTQMTLNTFHFAGRGEMNVTLGIPRLREILMVASANIKTPSMDIPLLDTPKVQQNSVKMKLKLTRVYLSQVLERVRVTEILKIRDKSNKSRQYTMKFSFLPHKVYREEYNVSPKQILFYVEKKFIKNLVAIIKKKTMELKDSSMTTSAEMRAPRASTRRKPTEEEDIDVEDDGQHDGDATSARSRDRQNEDLEYEGEEAERNEMGENEDESDDEISGEDLDEEDEEENETKSNRAESPILTETPNKAKLKASKNASKQRINFVKGSIIGCTSYAYDVDKELWCSLTLEYPVSQRKIDMTSLIEAEAKKAIVYETPGINRAFLSESKAPGEEGIIRMRTEGVNLMAMAKYDDILDLNKLYCNDIHQIAHTYGIEAAARVLIKEIRDVFAGYGITVDYRHLSLVADYMTFEGEYKPFNRKGLESNASPLQKMTFETTMNFLKAATITGERDDLKSPSSRLVVGRLVEGGTGIFDLVQPLATAS